VRSSVRPVMMDMNPILGVHPKFSNIYVVNGMGSKGSLIAPTLADIMFSYLSKGETIPPAYNVQRFNPMKA
jgi:glycine/D-amino acid oxidase-like deaminating enzyme